MGIGTRLQQGGRGPTQGRQRAYTGGTGDPQQGAGDPQQGAGNPQPWAGDHSEEGGEGGVGGLFEVPAP